MNEKEDGWAQRQQHVVAHSELGESLSRAKRINKLGSFIARDLQVYILTGCANEYIYWSTFFSPRRWWLRV